MNSIRRDAEKRPAELVRICVMRQLACFRIGFSALWLVLGPGCAVATSGAGASTSSEPTLQECKTAVAQAGALAAELPPDNVSRYFAERHLLQAMVEAGNGEFDECLEMAARAAEQARERRHELPPGEKLKVRQADE